MTRDYATGGPIPAGVLPDLEHPAPYVIPRRVAMTALPLRDFTDAERDRLAAIEAAPAAEESFDATAALRRVLAACDRLDAWLAAEIVTDNGFAEQIGGVVIDGIRAAVAGPTC